MNAALDSCFSFASHVKPCAAVRDRDAAALVPDKAVTPAHVDCPGEKVGRIAPSPHFI